jgi:hypothetical protein
MGGARSAQPRMMSSRQTIAARLRLEKRYAFAKPAIHP